MPRPFTGPKICEPDQKMISIISKFSFLTGTKLFGSKTKYNSTFGLPWKFEQMQNILDL
jgi:hypothetical protein